MLTTLRIQNFALIDQITIDFNKGFTVLTGETGSGKSILLGALNLILGERADYSVIGPNADKSIVEAEFDLSNYSLNDFFNQQDIDFGKNAEDEIYEILKTKYDDIEITSEYSTFDYKTKSEKLKIELKTRRNKSDAYPTTMIGLNKIKKCNDPDTTYLFIFKFTDQILFIKFINEIILVNCFHISNNNKYYY